MESFPQDLGGRPSSDWGDMGDPPDEIIKVLKDYGQNGIIISGVLSWIIVNRNSSPKNIWKTIALNHWREEEITNAKKALRDAGGTELEDKVPDMKTNRQKIDGKAERELKDILAALDYLSEVKKMPLILSTAGQQIKNPKVFGICSPRCHHG